MSRFKHTLATITVAVAGLATLGGASQSAHAHGYVSFGIGLPGYGYAAPPAYYPPPPPVYYAPAPSYYAPPVVYGVPYAYGRPYYHPYRHIYWGGRWRRW